MSARKNYKVYIWMKLLEDVKKLLPILGLLPTKWVN